MGNNEKTRASILEHCRKYPLLEVRDLFKFLFQSSFGCEHMVSSLERATDYVKREAEGMSRLDYEHIDKADLIDPLDGNYSRVHLAFLWRGISPEKLSELFYLSAKKEPNGHDELCRKLGIAREMICDGVIDLPLDEFDKLHGEWKELGYPAIHHSETFRREYRPAYRVIANEYISSILNP